MMKIRRNAFFFLALLATAALAGESCCKEKAEKKKMGIEPEFIPDPNDVEPVNATPKMIPDPDGKDPPPGWDEEDDGPYEPPLVQNPEWKEWTPRMIPNPAFQRQTFLSTLIPKVKGEVLEASPWVVLGVLLTALMNTVSLPLGTSHLGSGSFQLLKGAVIGLATPLCSCGVLPVAKGLLDGGISVGVVVAFLTASQSAGLDSAAITWGLLGPSAALCRLGGAVVLACVAGAAVGTTPATKQPATKTKATTATPVQPASVRKFVNNAISTAADLFPTVLLGLVVSTVVTHSLPPLDDMHHSLQDSVIGPVLGRVVVLFAALPLQLCEHTTVTLAAGIQKSGGSAGLAFAFLMSAPATNLPTLLLLLKAQHGARAWNVAVRGVVGLVGAALVLSYLVDFSGVDMLVQKESEVGGGSVFSLPGWYVKGSPWVAAGLAAAAGIKTIGNYASPKYTSFPSFEAAEGGDSKKTQ